MGNRKSPNPPPVDAVRPSAPPAPPCSPAEQRAADDAANRPTKEYGQRLDCLDLAMRLLERWPPEKASDWGAERRGGEAIDLAERFRLYLDGDAEGDEE